MAASDALRDALGIVLARARQEWQREHELFKAQAAATLAELRAQIAELKAAAERTMAGVRDGKDGADGRDGVDGKDGSDGADAPPVSDEAIAAQVARYLEQHPPAPGRDGRDGKDGADGRDGADGKDGRDGLDGRDGERGPQGEPGRLPVVREWEDRVHYVGDVVTFGGAVYQAQRDTGREPPHEDWRRIVAAGAEGRSMAVRGTWSATESYRELDVVALNGAGFVARRDDPGPCPGEGWQMIASQGRPGPRGERGADGLPGPRGKDAAPFLRADVSDGGVVRLLNADGAAVEIDLYPLLAQVAQARASR